MQVFESKSSVAVNKNKRLTFIGGRKAKVIITLLDDERILVTEDLYQRRLRELRDKGSISNEQYHALLSLHGHGDQRNRVKAKLEWVLVWLGLVVIGLALIVLL